MDAIQQHFTERAFETSFATLSEADIDGAKARLLETLGAVIAGFGNNAGGIARGLAAEARQTDGATVIGTGIRTSIDMAAFANATAAGTLSESALVIAPLLAAAEHVGTGGRDLIAAIALAEDIRQELSSFLPREQAFPVTNHAAIAAAVAVAKLLGLSREKLAECISLAATTNVMLDRDDDLAAGHVARAAVFVALTARAGMEGPKKPFEGKTGWLDHVAGGRIENRPAVGRAVADFVKAGKSFIGSAGPVVGEEAAQAIVEAVGQLENISDIAPVATAIRIEQRP